jgi:hypothetical protein
MANDVKVNLALSVEDVNLVLNALAELPAKLSMGLINNISVQAQQQLQATQQAPSMAEASRAVTNEIRDIEVNK